MKKIILIGIFCIALFLRVYKLGEIPRGIYIDEPSLGYNTYTILHTARDEYGELLPSSFKAFGEYKLPVYIYASVPLVAVFGLSAFSIRLLSALAGAAGVYAIYFLSREISKNENKKELIGLTSALVFAISPWSIQFSRAAFESNVATTLIIAAVYFIVAAINHSKNKYYVYSSILFSLALFTYNAERIFVPIILFSIFCIYRIKIMKNKSLFIGCSILLIAMGIIAANIYAGKDISRAMSVFELGNKELRLDPLIGTLQKYTTHFSPEFLFFSGDYNARHGVSELGVLFLIQIVFIPIGIYSLLKSAKSEAMLLLIWTIVAPIPAAIATPVPHALRALLLLVPLTIFSANGIIYAISYNKKTKFKISVATIICIIFGHSFINYIHVYYGHYSKKTAWDWQENSTLLGEYISKLQLSPDSKHIIEGDPRELIYIKFYNATQNKKTDISKYIFTNNNPSSIAKSGDFIAISGWKGLPSQMRNSKELLMTNKSIGYKVGEWQE